MIKLISDENFDEDIVRGLVRKLPELEVVRVHEVDLAATPDPVILAWAAAEERVLLTHDRDTIPDFAYDRVRAGEPMVGVFLVSNRMQKGQAIEQLSLALQCLTLDDCQDQVHISRSDRYSGIAARPQSCNCGPRKTIARL
jgi:predicted nuclease of predicted toxin-antitoxin system